MFENKELNRINSLEQRKLNLKKEINANNPNYLIKGYVEAKKHYNKAKLTNRITKSIQTQLIKESKRLAAILGYDDENILFGMSNRAIHTELSLMFDVDKLEKLRSEFDLVSEQLNVQREKYKKTKTAGGNKKRLINDTKQILEYYSKKMPQINVIDEQIKVIQEEADNYKANGLAEKYGGCIDAIKELKIRKQEVKQKFIVKNSDEFRRNYREKSEALRKDVNYLKLEKEKKQLRKEIDNTSPTLLLKHYKSAKENFTNVVLNLDDNSGPTEIEQEYLQIADLISQHTGLTIPELAGMEYSKILIVLREKIAEYNNELREQLTKKNVEISLAKSKFIDEYSTEDMLFEIFDYKNDETEARIPKEILASTYMTRVQAMVAHMCYKKGMTHLYDEALSGALVGLTVAINSWHKQQKSIDSALRFDDFYGIYVYKYAERSLYQISIGGSGSTAANYQHFSGKMRKDISKRVDAYINENPNMAGMKPELVEELFVQEEIKENIKKPINPVKETDYNAIIGGVDGAANMWELSTYQEKTISNDDLLDGKQKYGKLLNSITELMDLFDVKEDKKSGKFVVNEKRKLMDVYDRQIFLMRLGLDYKKTKSEVASSKSRDNYTWEEIAAEISNMKLQNGDSSGKISAPAVLARWDRMIGKLKIAINKNPRIKAGLEYMLNYIDNNRSLIEKLSNDREELAIKDERDMLRTNYADDADVMGIEMLDNTLLGDNYILSDDNTLTNSLNYKF